MFGGGFGLPLLFASRSLSRRLQGFAWCATFVVLDAAQAVLFGSFLQRMDSLALGFLVFGIPAAGCLALTAIRAPSEFRAALSAPGELLALNVSSAAGWLTYLGAIQLIEPAVAFTIFSGVIPLAIVAARPRLPADGGAPHGCERIGFAVLAMGLVALGASTMAGYSGFVRGGLGVAALGLGLAAFAGIAMAGMVLASYRLSARGVGPAAVFGLRFPLYLVLAGAGFLLGLDAKGDVAHGEFLVAVLLGLAVLAFPIYAVQKAVALTPASTLSAATALIPVAVLVLQLFDQRVSYSNATAAGLAIYTLGALLAAVGRARAEARSPAG